MATPKHNWDTRAWLLGIVGGTVGGSAAAWATYPPLQRRLNAPPLPLFGNHGADVISGTLIVLSVLVLPGLVSGLARRLTFLWGLVPLCLFFASAVVEDLIQNGIKSVIKDWWISLAGIGLFWVISSGPVSLIRWQRARAARRQEAQQAAYQAMREAGSVPQEGVWPPPPKTP